MPGEAGRAVASSAVAVGPRTARQVAVGHRTRSGRPSSRATVALGARRPSRSASWISMPSKIRRQTLRKSNSRPGKAVGDRRVGQRARRVAGGPVVQLGGEVARLDAHRPSPLVFGEDRTADQRADHGRPGAGSASGAGRRRRASSPASCADRGRRGRRPRRSRAARRRTTAPHRCAAPTSRLWCSCSSATAVDQRAGHDRLTAADPCRASWPAMLADVFIAAVFISRTVSKARRTISSACSSVASPACTVRSEAAPAPARRPPCGSAAPSGA